MSQSLLGYAAAPATALVAAFCACCARPLVDAVSVETGVGPECRRKHGYATAQGAADWALATAALEGVVAADDLARWASDAHRAANVIVHRIAVAQRGPDVNRLTNALHALGYVKLAARIAKRLVSVRIAEEGDELVVETPFSPEANDAFRQLPTRRWDGERKANRVHASNRPALWRLLRTFFAGASALGPKGLFVIG